VLRQRRFFYRDRDAFRAINWSQSLSPGTLMSQLHPHETGRRSIIRERRCAVAGCQALVVVVVETVDAGLRVPRVRMSCLRLVTMQGGWHKPLSLTSELRKSD